MTITINPTASQNPFTDANLSQSNSGTCAVDGSGKAFQSSAATLNYVYGNATFSSTQSAQATIRYLADYFDGAVVDSLLQLLYTNANNRVALNLEYNGTNNTFARLRTVIGGTTVDTNIATGLADGYFADGDVVKLEVSWSGADASFILRKNGTQVGSTITKTSFALTSGAPGFNLERNGGGTRAVGFSQLVLTGESGDTTPPTLSAPVGSATASTTATVGATTDEGNGTLYAVVTGSATQPSVAQIKAGNDHTGSAAVWSGNVAVSSTGAKTLNATGLTGGSSYYVHLVHTDAAANDSNRVTSSQWTQLVKKVKLKLDLAAAGETVDGIVWANQVSAIAGAEIGEFTGQTIGTGSGADTGFAVLKVPVSAFGGGSLSVGDTVQMYVRKPDGSKDSNVWAATVIEE